MSNTMTNTIWRWLQKPSELMPNWCQTVHAQATAISDLTSVKECMTDPSAAACTATYGSRWDVVDKDLSKFSLMKSFSNLVSFPGFASFCSISFPAHLCRLCLRQNAMAPPVPPSHLILMSSKSASKVKSRLIHQKLSIIAFDLRYWRCQGIVQS